MKFANNAQKSHKFGDIKYKNPKTGEAHVDPV
jgi:hypothetical protein